MNCFSFCTQTSWQYYFPAYSIFKKQVMAILVFSQRQKLKRKYALVFQITSKVNYNQFLKKQYFSLCATNFLFIKTMPYCCVWCIRHNKLTHIVSQMLLCVQVSKKGLKENLQFLVEMCDRICEQKLTLFTPDDCIPENLR